MILVKWKKAEFLPSRPSFCEVFCDWEKSPSFYFAHNFFVNEGIVVTDPPLNILSIIFMVSQKIAIFVCDSILHWVYFLETIIL